MAGAASAEERLGGGGYQINSHENLISTRNLNSPNRLESSPGLSLITEKSQARGMVVESNFLRSHPTRGSGFMVPYNEWDIFLPRGKM